MSAGTVARSQGVRHRELLGALGVLLLAGGIVMVVNDRLARGRLDAEFRDFEGFPSAEEMLENTLPANTAAGVVLIVAALAVFGGIAKPRLVRRSPPVAAGLVVVAAVSLVYVSFRTLLPQHGEPLRGENLLLLVTDVATVTALTAGIAVPLLRRRPGGPAATGAVALWGAVMAVVLVRQSFQDYVSPSFALNHTELGIALAGDALLVVAAALLVTAWCAGPPADPDRVLARCRGGLAAVALLLPSDAAGDIALAMFPLPLEQAPDDWWLVLRAGVTLATAAAAAGAAVLLRRRPTPIPAAVVAALGLVWTAVHVLPAFGGFDLDRVGVYAVLITLVAPLLIAGVVARQTMASSVRSASPENRDASNDVTSTAGD